MTETIRRFKDLPSQEDAGRHGYVVIAALEKIEGEQRPTQIPGRYVIVRDCPLCGEDARIEVAGQGLWNWEHGEFIQNAFPELGPAERELIMTGMHDECYNNMFAEEEV